MNKFLIEIDVTNYDKDNCKMSRSITLDEISEYKFLIKVINKNSGNKTWNWFECLPEKWDGEKYIDDDWLISHRFNENFQYNLPDKLIKKFFKKFTPNGADRINYIKLYKVEEIFFEDN